MKKLFVKPGPGRKPRHLETGRNIRTEGEWINDSPSLRRLLKNGDVVPAAAPKENAAPPAAAPETAQSEAPKKSAKSRKALNS